MRIILREPPHAAALVKEMYKKLCKTLAKVPDSIVIVAFCDNYQAMNAMVLLY